MGKEMENGDAPAEVDADVSAVGTLVWVRRANGSWWPGRVVSPNEVPDCCPAPPRSPATPILLLGRRDGPVFVEWLNLERSKRVKPFRCGERGLEDCIRRAVEQQQAAARRLCSKTTATKPSHSGGSGGSKYARKDDAVLQALEIERERSSGPATNTTSKPSHSAPVADAGVQHSSVRKRRRTPNDSEDDAPQRMKDLTEIRAPPKHATPNAAAAFADLNKHLPSTSQMKRSKQSHHHDSSKRNQPWPSSDQDQPCGVSRKRDRSRPLSELCNGDAWNGHRPNGQRAHQHLMHAASSLEVVLDTKPSSRRVVGPVKTEVGYGGMWKNGLKPNGQRVDQHLIRAASSLDMVLDTRSSSHRAVGPVKAEPIDDGFPVDVHLATRSIMKTDHLHVHQPCASTKAPTLECTTPASNCSKDGISSQRDSRNPKKEAVTSFDHEGINKTKNAAEHEHLRERAAKHKAPSNGVILLEKRVEKNTATANKTTAPADDSKTKNAPEHEHLRERAAKHNVPSNGVILLEKRVKKNTATANKTTAPADNYKIKNAPEHEHLRERSAKHKAPSNGVILLEKKVKENTATAKKTTAPADDYKTKNAPEHEHLRERSAKHKPPSNGVILLEKKVENNTATANKTTAPADDYNGLAVISPNGLDCVRAALQQRSETKCKHEAVLQKHSGIKCKVEEPAETISNHPNLENVPVPSAVFELPHQVLPPQHDPMVARCHVVKPIKTLQLNPSLYDVQLSAQGAGSSSSKGGRVPLVSLMSRSSQRPVVGYPVSVVVLDDSAPRPPSAASINDDHHPSTSNNGNKPIKGEVEEATAAAPQPTVPPPLSSSHKAARATRAKAKGRRKASEDDESWRPHTKNNNPTASSSANLKSRRKTLEDETWRPHTKNQVSSSSPRKMRRLSSFAPSQRRGGGGGGDRRPATVVGPLAVACIPLRLVFSRIHEALS